MSINLAKKSWASFLPLGKPGLLLPPPAKILTQDSLAVSTYIILREGLCGVASLWIKR